MRQSWNRFKVSCHILFTYGHIYLHKLFHNVLQRGHRIGKCDVATRLSLTFYLICRLWRYLFDFFGRTLSESGQLLELRLRSILQVLRHQVQRRRDLLGIHFLILWNLNYNKYVILLLSWINFLYRLIAADSSPRDKQNKTKIVTSVSPFFLHSHLFDLFSRTVSTLFALFIIRSRFSFPIFYLK